MFSLFLKESLTFHRPGSKWGEQKCCQTRRGWKRLLSGAGKGFIGSIYCHGNSECDLEASLAWGQMERFGEKKKKQRLDGGSRGGGKAAALAQPPEGGQEPRCLLCKSRFRSPSQCGPRGQQPMPLLQVAQLDEHAGHLVTVVLAKGGRTPHVLPCFLHLFIICSLCTQFLCVSWAREGAQQLCPLQRI